MMSQMGREIEEEKRNERIRVTSVAVEDNRALLSA